MDVHTGTVKYICLFLLIIVNSCIDGVIVHIQMVILKGSKSLHTGICFHMNWPVGGNQVWRVFAGFLLLVFS